MSILDQDIFPITLEIGISQEDWIAFEEQPHGRKTIFVKSEEIYGNFNKIISKYILSITGLKFEKKSIERGHICREDPKRLLERFSVLVKLFHCRFTKKIRSGKYSCGENEYLQMKLRNHGDIDELIDFLDNFESFEKKHSHLVLATKFDLIQ